jgi:hypothetical protein
MNPTPKDQAVSHASVVLPTRAGSQDDQIQTAGLERKAKRLAGTQQMALADHPGDRAGAVPLERAATP